MRTIALFAAAVLTIALGTRALGATVNFDFTTGNPDGLIGTATRPPSAGKPETETADDFVLTQQTKLQTASFTGVVTGTGPFNFPRVTVDIYRVFPNESDATRTITVPTRVNSPGDVELDGRDTAAADMSFTTADLGAGSAANSILNGIAGLPDPTTGGEGPINGQMIRFDVTFTTPIDLAPDHYFFRPEVEVEGDGQFYWLSAAKPIAAPGTPFTPDLQSWIRNEALAPDWVRIGTDVVGPAESGGTAPTFNASFSIHGEVSTTSAIPLPAAFWPGVGLIGARAAFARRSKSILV
jgi:hypothetical protein